MGLDMRYVLSRLMMSRQSFPGQCQHLYINYAQLLQSLLLDSAYNRNKKAVLKKLHNKQVSS